jgi:hypothetical protein
MLLVMKFNKSFLLLSILLPLFLFLLHIFRPHTGKEYRAYTVYANDDITLITENGEMIFIPFGALRESNGNGYYGMVTIKLSPYLQLLDSLNRFNRMSTLIHRLQLNSPIIDCTDEAGRSLSLNSYRGYGMLFFMPIAPLRANRYQGSLIRAPKDLFLAKNGFDSFGVKYDLQEVFPFSSSTDLLARSKLPSLSDSTDKRQYANLAWAKLNSIRVFRQFLQYNWTSATAKFIQSSVDSVINGLSNSQCDQPDMLPYLGFNILELYNKNGNTNLLRIFEKNAKKWEQSLLITDWTGSMHIHEREIDSLIENLEMKNIIRHLVLYNDKPDPGFASLEGTEGFFSIDSVESFKQVKALMRSCAADYWGGENLEESDFSALIRATSRKNPAWQSPYKQVIMLVDNNAPPRDTTLFNQIGITTNIYVIAYGAEKANDVNIYYHNLVKKFGGLLFAEGNEPYYDDSDSIRFHDCRSVKCIGFLNNRK